VYRKSGPPLERRNDPEPSERSHQCLKLTDQYIALLVLVFTNAGLVDVSTDRYRHPTLFIFTRNMSCRQALTSMLEESTTGSNLSRKATLLMAEILEMVNRVLPLSVAAKIQVVILSLLEYFMLMTFMYGRLFLEYLVLLQTIVMASTE